MRLSLQAVDDVGPRLGVCDPRSVTRIAERGDRLWARLGAWPWASFIDEAGHGEMPADWWCCPTAERTLVECLEARLRAAQAALAPPGPWACDYTLDDYTIDNYTLDKLLIAIGAGSGRTLVEISERLRDRGLNVDEARVRADLEAESRRDPAVRLIRQGVRRWYLTDLGQTWSANLTGSPGR